MYDLKNRLNIHITVDDPSKRVKKVLIYLIVIK